MRTLLLLLLALTPGAAAAQAQEHSYRLGDKTVAVPPPAGFVEATSRSETVKKFFSATEAAELDLLAVHVPADVMGRIERGAAPDLLFFTKVSVSKQLRGHAATPEFFAGLAAYMRANNAKLFDMNSPEMRAQMKRQSKNLTDLLKERTAVDLSQPVLLGELEGTPNSFGTLVVMTFNFQSGGQQARRTLVSGISAVRVKERVLWVYTYKAFNSDKDADDLRAFTKGWLADIIRANQ